MQNISLYNFMVFFIPGLSSIFMLTLLGWDILGYNDRSRMLKIWLFCCIFMWMLTIFIPIFYYALPHVYVYTNWLYYVALLLYPVFFYHFIFDLTRISANYRFSNLHYVFPAFVAALMLVLLFVTPFSEQLDKIANHEKFPHVSGFYGIVSESKPLVKFIYEVAYLVASYFCLRRYKRFIINYSSNESKSSLRWTHQSLCIFLIPISLSILLMIVPHDAFIKSPLISWPVLLIPFLQIFLVYHILKGEYILPEVEINTASRPIFQYDQTDVLKKSLLTKPLFEEYIHQHQPYLNPDLKITDLVNDLQLNRTYISGFINNEYHLNFNQYINQCRLNEYYRMRSDTAYSDKTDEELCISAGFSNYRYFMRLEKEQSKTNP